MKFSTLTVLFGLCILGGCGIQEEIDKAANTCESIVSEALEGLEDTCLTKEDVIDLINTLRVRTDDTNEVSCQEDTLP